MMSVATSVNRDAETRERVKSQLRAGYNRVTDWANPTEIGQHTRELRSALNEALLTVAAKGLQQPFLVQPLWRTVGQSFELAADCFDVFVWSDVAIMRLALELSSDSSKVQRPTREVARHVKALYEILSQGDYDYDGTYKGMPLGLQTGKSFAVSGRSSIKYLSHEYLRRPRLPRSVLTELITGGGERELRPERRFDAAVVSYMIGRQSQLKS